MDDDFDHNASWYDITVEEEERIEKECIESEQGSRPLINTKLYPLEEADPLLEEAEQLAFISTSTPTRRPIKSRLGPRASKRHTTDNVSSNVHSEQHSLAISEARTEVFSRLGPRASLRHMTPDNKSNKRNFSPRKDSCPTNKKSRTSGTPTRGARTRNSSGTPTSKKTPHTKTPVTPQDFKTPDNADSKKILRTPNTDSRLCVKNKRGKALKFDDENKPSSARKRFTSESSSSSATVELTENQIKMREKQVKYGKVTDGYQNYQSIIPKSLRSIRDPRTPQKSQPYSKRCWDGLVKSWRKRLHDWDDPVLGLTQRSVYSKNNRDLKQAGLITDAGDVVMFTQHQSSNNSELPDTTQDLLEEYEITKCSDFTLKTDFSHRPITVENIDHMTSLHQSEQEWDPLHQSQAREVAWLKSNLEQLDNFMDNDDAKSQDSDYANLIKGIDLPECDDSDTDYRLSQDADFEDMDCEEYQATPLRHLLHT